MTILKNGKILKETYYFECPSCDCHWTANCNEVERRSSSVSNMSTASIFVMRCPQCLKTGVVAKYVDYGLAKINVSDDDRACINAADYSYYNNKTISTNTP